MEPLLRVFEHARELGPDFILAWAGWLVHSFVHSAGHILRQVLRAAYTSAKRLV